MVVTHNSWILRNREETDEVFANRCFESARGGNFEALPEPLRGTLMAQQWRAFEHSVATTAGRLDRIVEQAGVPVGRVVESREATDWWLVDIAFLHEVQGQGLGSAVLSKILEEARAEGACVRLHVRLGHRALAWYQRLGFVEVGRDEQDIEMRAL